MFARSTMPSLSKQPVTIEPVLFLLFLVQGGLKTLQGRYIEHRLTEIYNYTAPLNESTICSNDNGKDPTQIKIEATTDTLMTYLWYEATLIPIASALFLTTLSDFIGRKPTLIISSVGYIAASLMTFLVVYLKLPLALLLVPQGVLGVCGGKALLLSISFSYIADVTIHVQNTRSIGFVLLDLMRYLGFGIAFISIDVFLKETQDYVLAFLLLCIPAFLSFIYIILPWLLLESCQPRPIQSNILEEIFLSVFYLFKQNGNGRRLKLLLLLVCLFLYVIVNEELLSVIVSYGQRTPFCWTHNDVRVYRVVGYITPAIASVIVVKLLSPWTSDSWFVRIGLSSGIALLLSSALATTNSSLLYIAPVLGLLRILPSAIFQSVMSKNVTSAEQGTLFGSIAVVISIARFSSPFLMNGIFQHMAEIHQLYIIFYIAIGILVIPLVLMSILDRLSEWHPQPGYLPLQGDDQMTHEAGTRHDQTIDT
ncbi:proton-coupled folate transporter-like [Asterias rubens]|uniref:proton-coupled folate transporter-like n=1 Tax=Asterias rubens TaxID=7604 RepID=UPI0014551C5F|nr:proton-coupled folate transporter-like [Asterias rubens]